jgi:hypothetical protein
MTMPDAIQQAQTMLGIDAPEEEIAQRAATLWIQAATPEQREQVAYAEMCEEVCDVLIEHATTEDERQARLAERAQLRAEHRQIWLAQ